MKASLSVEGLVLKHGRRCVLRGLSGEFPAGSMTAVIGPNGAGKSSLLSALGGHLVPAGGRIVRDPSARIAWLPQVAELDRGFPVRVGELAALGLWPRLGAWRGVDARGREAVRRALAEVGLEGLHDRLVGELSAGQFQRLLFARLALQEADVILLDEPFNAVDARTVDHLLTSLRRWRAEGRTVIAVLHQTGLVRAHFPRCLALEDGEGRAWGATADVLAGAFA